LQRSNQPDDYTFDSSPGFGWAASGEDWSGSRSPYHNGCMKDNIVAQVTVTIEHAMCTTVYGFPQYVPIVDSSHIY